VKSSGQDDPYQTKARAYSVALDKMAMWNTGASACQSRPLHNDTHEPPFTGRLYRNRNSNPRSLGQLEGEIDATRVSGYIHRRGFSDEKNRGDEVTSVIGAQSRRSWSGGLSLGAGKKQIVFWQYLILM
jgi:hypothetical protein